jgi:pimeloyl-ACP methyl ester carboxylesterase
MPIIDILGTPHVYELSAPVPSRPVLVFVHGWLLSRSYWQPLLEKLTPQYQCLTYDLRGFGDSCHLCPAQDNETSYSLTTYAQDLQILLSSLNLQVTWLIGHSLGGTVALQAADLEAQRIKGVICLNSGGGIYLKEEFERFRTMGQQIVQQRPKWLLKVPFIDLVFARMMVHTPLSPQWGRQRVMDFVSASREAALGSLLATTTESEVHRLPQLVSRLQQPVYFVAGKEDKVMESKYVEHLASFHPLFNTSTGNVKEIPNSGHLSMVEQPERVGEAILQILHDHGA